jgi:hypothetical protein
MEPFRTRMMIAITLVSLPFRFPLRIVLILATRDGAALDEGDGHCKPEQDERTEWRIVVKVETKSWPKEIRCW